MTREQGGVQRGTMGHQAANVRLQTHRPAQHRGGRSGGTNLNQEVGFELQEIWDVSRVSPGVPAHARYTPHDPDSMAVGQCSLGGPPWECHQDPLYAPCRLYHQQTVHARLICCP